MKIEIRVFRHDKAAPVHTEEVDSSKPFNIDAIAYENDLGHPLRTTDDGKLYENGEIQIVPLEKVKAKTK